MTATVEDHVNYFGKSVGVGLTAATIDKFWFGSPYTRSAAFGATVAAAVLVGDVISDRVMNTHAQVDKSIEARTAEVLLTAGSFYGIEKGLGQLDNQNRPFNERLGVAILSELIGEFVFNLV